MSPIDDELRAALQRRATALAPSPDPLAGIERRAGRMRRNRVAASVAGSVLAVAAIATAVPLLAGSVGQGPDVPRLASTAPSPAPSAVATTPSYALDPSSPWPYRGVPVAELGQGYLETVTREYAVKRGVDEAQVQLTPLFGQVPELAQSAELVFLATVAGEHRWGVATSSEAGPEFLADEPLPSPALALAAALPGDEVPRLLVVASPEAGAIEHVRDEAVEDGTPLFRLADGVVTGPLEGDHATDSLLVREADGRELWRGPAPDLGQSPPQAEPPVPGDEVPAPANAVDWPLRGAVPVDVAERALVAFADAAGVSRDEIGSRLLFGAERDGTHYVLLQGWSGGAAQGFAWAGSADGTSAAVLLPATAPGPAAFGVVLDGVLVVVPEPAAGQVLYDPDGTGEPQPVPDQGTGAAVLLERAPDASDDRLLVLDGDGDPERPVFRGTVEELLAATSS